MHVCILAGSFSAHAPAFPRTSPSLAPASVARCGCCLSLLFSKWKIAKHELPADVEAEVPATDQRDSELKITPKLGESVAFG